MKVTTDACLFGAWAAKEIRKILEPERILDIGAGTGLLSLMLAQATTNSRIEAIESNEYAFQEAKANFADSPWRQRLKAHHQTLQNLDPEEKYDVIICNPPFFKGSFKGKNDDKNQALHSEDLSQRELLAKVQPLLAKTGTFFLLYPQREMRVFQLFAQSSDLHLLKHTQVQNESGSSIFRSMSAFGFRSGDEKEDTLSIKTNNGKYTPEFWELLKDYYLEYNDPNHESKQ